MIMPSPCSSRPLFLLLVVVVVLLSFTTSIGAQADEQEPSFRRTEAAEAQQFISGDWLGTLRDITGDGFPLQGAGLGLGKTWGEGLEAISRIPEEEANVVKVGILASVIIIEGIDFLKDSKSRSDLAKAISDFVEPSLRRMEATEEQQFINETAQNQFAGDWRRRTLSGIFLGDIFLGDGFPFEFPLRLQGAGSGLGEAWRQGVRGVANRPEAVNKIIKAGILASVIIIEGIDFLKDSKSRSDMAKVINDFVEPSRRRMEAAEEQQFTDDTSQHRTLSGTTLGDDFPLQGADIGLGEAWGQAVEGIARSPAEENNILTAGILGSVIVIEGIDFLKDSKSRSDLAKAIKDFVKKFLSP